MSTNKSVSPAEFRLHNKVFSLDYAPQNYFERLRFEMVFQQLVTWFWRQYGVYFYIQKLKLLDEKVLLQVYFYKTYLYQQGVKRTLKFTATKSTEGLADNARDNRYKAAFEWFYMYSPELLALFTQLKRGSIGSKKLKPSVSRHNKKAFSFLTKTKIRSGPVSGSKSGLPHRELPFFTRNRAFSRRPSKPSFLTVRPQHSVTMWNQFFTYFFLHFFKLQAVVLAKSLYKAVTANALFKHEHQVLLYRTRFLKWHRWAFDFLFLANFALTFSNMNFVLPFYLTHVVKKYNQFKHAEFFFNILRKLYFYKRNIRAIKVLINGPYNRHGRTHFRVFKIGDLALSQSQSCVMYDAIQWLTPYGAVSLKLWVYYADYWIAK